MSLLRASEREHSFWDGAHRLLKMDLVLAITKAGDAPSLLCLILGCWGRDARGEQDLVLLLGKGGARCQRVGARRAAIDATVEADRVRVFLLLPARRASRRTERCG